MRPIDTIIKIELVIVLAHRNSGAYRCCTWFVNLGRSIKAQKLTYYLSDRKDHADPNPLAEDGSEGQA